MIRHHHRKGIMAEEEAKNLETTEEVVEEVVETTESEKFAKSGNFV